MATQDSAQAPAQNGGHAPVHDTAQTPAAQHPSQTTAPSNGSKPGPQRGSHPPATRHSARTIDDEDVADWRDRIHTVLDSPGAHVKSKSPTTASQWYSGFFDCFTPFETCLVTYFLPCVTFGKTYHRIRKNNDLEGYEPVNTSCLLYFIAGCCAWVPVSMQRQNIREKYNLEGSCMKDIAAACCCHCCVLIQADKEAEHHERLLRSHAVQQAPYEANNGMQYPNT